MKDAGAGKGRKVPDILRWRAAASPDALALKAGALEWSYRELHERVGALSAVLLSHGVRRGDRVALLMPPSETYVALVHSAARIGAVTVPLNHRGSSRELDGLLRDSLPSLVVHDGERSRVTRHRPKMGSASWVPASELASESASLDGRPVQGEEMDASATAAIVYTSGSSGAPKGVELTISNLVWNAVSVGLRIGASPGDRWLLCLPLFHVGGYTVLFRSLLHGSGLVLHPRFEPERVSLSLDNDGVTLASFVPTMLGDLLKARGEKPLPPGLRLIFLGGAQPPPHLVSDIIRRNLPVLLTYGMTETCSQVAVSDDWEGEGGLAHLPLFPSELLVARVLRGRVRPSPPGEHGEVLVRGPSVSRGYWRKPALTRARFRQGWFLTGDLGLVREERLQGGRDGGIVILGRRGEMIVTGGEKVFPAEVERTLREHPGVKDAVVLGLEDAKWGERVVAVVETSAGDEMRPSREGLAAFLKERLGGYKVPKEYHIWRELPRTSTGKPRRGEVRSRLERERGAP